MARTFSYNQAVRLLGGHESAAVRVIDRISSMVMLVLGVSGVKEILSWFDPRAEFIRSSHQLIADISGKIGPAKGRTRTELLIAAHSIIVITAYFEAFKSVRLPFNPKRLKLDKDDQLTLAGGKVINTSGARDLLEALLDAELPIPTPLEPREVIRNHLLEHYQKLSVRLVAFLTEWALWDELDDTTRVRVRRISSEIPRKAVDRYEELFRSIAAQCPEFLSWINLQDHEATRKALRRTASETRVPLQQIYRHLDELKTGLERMNHLLSMHVERPNLAGARAALAQGYQAALTRPIVDTTPLDAHAGLNIPPLGLAYVDPSFRLRRSGVDDRPAEESWWKKQAVWDDLPTFLAGFFTSPYASEVPLVVLGQPGSGKSVLTRILAARLPPEDFVVIRVELRAAPANAPIQDQIETAIQQLTGERVSYTGLMRAADGALPVILLDGFDELLQSTGVSRSNYLEQVREFQRREADLDRPVAVVVTTRTVVAERARFPQGSMVMRLEPFGAQQVTRWLSVWNRKNESYYQARGVQPFAPEVALQYADLAAQPLLLLMLALFDADSNALASSRLLGEADLYEGLLSQFARREIVKLRPWISPELLAEEVERELKRLGIVAFSMFNRGRQSIHDYEVNEDIQAILGDSGARQVDRSEFDEPLSAAQLIVGRFFFIHESQASFKESRTRTYEFLHATFGEYLVARLVGRELQRLVRLHAADGLPLVRSNAGRLRALLSFAPLATRTAIVQFINGIFHPCPREERALTHLVVRDLLKGTLLANSEEKADEYVPVRLVIPAMRAVWSANIVLLCLLSAAGPASASTLFQEQGDGLELWRRYTSLWKSQLTPEAWRSMVYAIEIERCGSGDERDLTLSLRLSGDAFVPKLTDLHWSLGIEDVDELSTYPIPDVHAEANFLCDPGWDALIHALQPVASLKELLGDISLDRNGCAVNGAFVLLRLCMQLPSQSFTQATADCLTVIYISEGLSQKTGEHYLDCVLRWYESKLSGGETAPSAAEVLQAVLESRWSTSAHAAKVGRCAMEELGRMNDIDEEMLEILRAAINRLDPRNHSDELVGLWVAAAECGLSSSSISERLERIERFVHEAGERLVFSHINRARLRRAIRLTS